MKRVEFIGPNGVGKTTTVRWLLAQSNNALLDQQNARIAIAKASLGSVRNKVLFRRIEFLFKSRRKRRARWLRDQAAVAYLARSSGEKSDFVDLALKIITESSLSVHDKWAEVKGFFDSLYDALYFKSNSNVEPGAASITALCDESISLKVLMLAALAHSHEDALRLFELMPLPDAIVNLSGNEQEIYARLSQRESGKPFTYIHYLRDGKEAVVVQQLKRLTELADDGCKILAARGCRVVNLDVDQLDLPAQAAVLAPLLQNLAEDSASASVAAASTRN